MKQRGRLGGVRESQWWPTAAPARAWLMLQPGRAEPMVGRARLHPLPSRTLQQPLLPQSQCLQPAPGAPWMPPSLLPQPCAASVGSCCCAVSCWGSAPLCGRGAGSGHRCPPVLSPARAAGRLSALLPPHSGKAGLGMRLVLTEAKVPRVAALPSTARVTQLPPARSTAAGWTHPRAGWAMPPSAAWAHPSRARHAGLSLATSPQYPSPCRAGTGIVPPVHVGDDSECREETGLMSKGEPLAGCGSGCSQADHCPGCPATTDRVTQREEFWHHERDHPELRDSWLWRPGSD